MISSSSKILIVFYVYSLDNNKVIHAKIKIEISDCQGIINLCLRMQLDQGLQFTHPSVPVAVNDMSRRPEMFAGVQERLEHHKKNTKVKVIFRIGNSSRLS